LLWSSFLLLLRNLSASYSPYLRGSTDLTCIKLADSGT
jgi:hypothetical protein